MFQFNENEAIWKQIGDDIKKKIFAGQYLTGSQIESVRELASMYGVNPNTIVKSLAVLEQEGVIKTERGIGKFVAFDQQQIDDNKKQWAESIVNHCIEECAAINVDINMILEIIKMKGE